MLATLAAFLSALGRWPRALCDARPTGPRDATGRAACVPAHCVSASPFCWAARRPTKGLRLALRLVWSLRLRYGEKCDALARVRTFPFAAPPLPLRFALLLGRTAADKRASLGPAACVVASASLRGKVRRAGARAHFPLRCASAPVALRPFVGPHGGRQKGFAWPCGSCGRFALLLGRRAADKRATLGHAACPWVGFVGYLGRRRASPLRSLRRARLRLSVPIALVRRPDRKSAALFRPRLAAREALLTVGLLLPRLALSAGGRFLLWAALGGLGTL